MSGIINDMIDRQLQQDAQDAIASEARAEERIRELITVGTDQMVETAKEIRDMNAKFGAYAIANFELMKQDRSDHVRQEALNTGARRLRQDLDASIQEVGADTPSTSTTTDTATESAASAQPAHDEAADSSATDTPDDVEDTPSGDSATPDVGNDTTDEDADENLFEELRRDRE